MHCTPERAYSGPQWTAAGLPMTIATTAVPNHTEWHPKKAEERRTRLLSEEEEDSWGGHFQFPFLVQVFYYLHLCIF
jgi:hypothetical protein